MSLSSQLRDPLTLLQKQSLLPEQQIDRKLKIDNENIWSTVKDSQMTEHRFDSVRVELQNEADLLFREMSKDVAQISIIHKKLYEYSFVENRVDKVISEKAEDLLKFDNALKLSERAWKAFSNAKVPDILGQELRKLEDATMSLALGSNPSSPANAGMRGLRLGAGAAAEVGDCECGDRISPTRVNFAL